MFQLNCYIGRLKPGAAPAQPCRWKGKVYAGISRGRREQSQELEPSNWGQWSLIPKCPQLILEAICMPQQIIYHHYRYDWCLCACTCVCVCHSTSEAVTLSVTQSPCCAVCARLSVPWASRGSRLHLPPQHRSVGFTAPLVALSVAGFWGFELRSSVAARFICWTLSSAFDKLFFLKQVRTKFLLLMPKMQMRKIKTISLSCAIKWGDRSKRAPRRKRC